MRKPLTRIHLILGLMAILAFGLLVLGFILQFFDVSELSGIVHGVGVVLLCASVVLSLLYQLGREIGGRIFLWRHARSGWCAVEMKMVAEKAWSEYLALVSAGNSEEFQYLSADAVMELQHWLDMRALLGEKIHLYLMGKVSIELSDFSVSPDRYFAILAQGGSFYATNKGSVVWNFHRFKMKSEIAISMHQVEVVMCFVRGKDGVWKMVSIMPRSPEPRFPMPHFSSTVN